MPRAGPYLLYNDLYKSDRTGIENPYKYWPFTGFYSLSKTHKSASIDVPNKRTVEHLSGVLLMALLVTFVLLPVNNVEAATPSHTLENADAQRIGSNRVLSGALACGNAFEQGGSSGSRCFMEQMVQGHPAGPDHALRQCVRQKTLR